MLSKVLGLLLNVGLIKGIHDKCPYYDGQLVRLQNLKKNELNGKLGTINNERMYKDRAKANMDRCGVEIDGNDILLLIEMNNLSKVPTIFIESEQYGPQNQPKLHKFITEHPQELFGIADSSERVKHWIEFNILPSNAFGYEEPNALAVSTMSSFPQGSMMDKNVHELFMCSSEIVKPVFEDEEQYEELKRLFDLHYTLNQAKGFGHFNNIEDPSKAQVKEYLAFFENLIPDYSAKLKEPWKIASQLVMRYISEAKCNEYADAALMNVKQKLINWIMGNDVIPNHTKQKIIQETLNDNFVQNIRDLRISDGKHWNYMQVLRSLFASENIVARYMSILEDDKNAQNMYIVAAQGNIEDIKDLVEFQLSKQKLSKRIVESKCIWK